MGGNTLAGSRSTQIVGTSSVAAAPAGSFGFDEPSVQIAPDCSTRTTLPDSNESSALAPSSMRNPRKL